MNELLTISEYSKIRGCSVSAVYKRLKSPSNKIHSYVVIQDDQTFLKAEILVAEGLRPLDTTELPPPDRRSEAENCPSNTAPKPVEEVEKKVEEGIGALAIHALEEQLLQKDKIIEDLNRRLDEAAKHEREISDKLAALVAQANELQRNNQILLAQAQQPQIEAPQEQPEAAAPERKRSGFLRRWLFGE